ncbi:MAG: YfiR family protein [Limisphaerales bacterium]
MFLLLPFSASPQPLSPYDVKAAFIYNFLKFVEWPPESFTTDETPYVVGVLGRDPFGGALERTMRGKLVNNRRIVVVRLDYRDMRNCHLLFVSASERPRYREIFAELGNAPVLTVGDTEDFADEGGAIGFFVEENKVRFEINPNAARRANLRLSSNLLGIARIVPGR